MNIKNVSIAITLIGFLIAFYGAADLFKGKVQEEKSLQKGYEVLVQSDTKKSNIRDEFSPKIGETVGILTIPRINADLPIIEGTDADELEKGVGHYGSSAYPQEKSQIILSGHRDTVFRRMGELQVGDQFIVKLPYGEFKYEFMDAKIVDADDTSVIKNTYPQEELLLTTCYPFSYLGNAPQRYVITAYPVEER